MKNILTEEQLLKIKGIQFKAKHLVNATFSGEYKSTFKGRGIEFDEVRQYQLGDDVKTIDWNVTARTGAPFVKIYKDERELTVIFVVDVSASMQFGSKIPKNEVAAEVAALLAYLALNNNDKVGLIIFSDRIEHFIPPKKGRGHIWKVIRDILNNKSQSKKTDFKVPLEFLTKVIKKRAITFLISDFQDDLNERLLRVISSMHELVAMPIVDKIELEIPKIGYIELEDMETNEHLVVNTSASNFNKKYLKLKKDHYTKLEKTFARCNIESIRLNSYESYIDEIVKFFRNRGRHVG